MMTTLDEVWAESQIEGMADGTLSPDAEKRMLDAMRRDQSLAERVRQARAMLGQLKAVDKVSVPRGLFWRLWRIPAEDRRAGSRWLLPAGLAAAAASVALALNLFFGVQGPTVEEQAQAAAIEDFTIVMAYLQKSAVMATGEVNQAVGTGVLDALAVSRGMVSRSETEFPEGE